MNMFKRSRIISILALVLIGGLLAQDTTKTFSYANNEAAETQQELELTNEENNNDELNDKSEDDSNLYDSENVENTDSDIATGENTDSDITVEEDSNSTTGENIDTGSIEGNGDTLEEDKLDTDNTEEGADDPDLEEANKVQDSEEQVDEEQVNEEQVNEDQNADEKNVEEKKSVQAMEKIKPALKNNKALAAGSVQAGFFTSVKIIDTKTGADVASLSDVKRGAEVRIEYEYKVPAGDMAVKTNYTFTIPKEIYIEDGQII